MSEKRKNKGGDSSLAGFLRDEMFTRMSSAYEESGGKFTPKVHNVVAAFAKSKLSRIEFEFGSEIATAEEMAQDVVMAVWQLLEEDKLRNRTGAGFYACTHRIAYNKRVDWFWACIKHKKRFNTLTVPGPDDDLDVHVDDDPEDYVKDNKVLYEGWFSNQTGTKEIFKVELPWKPERYSDEWMIWDGIRRGLTYAQIGESLSIGTGTVVSAKAVESRVARIKARLQRGIDDGLYKVNVNLGSGARRAARKLNNEAADVNAENAVKTENEVVAELLTGHRRKSLDAALKQLCLAKIPSGPDKG